MGSGISGQCAQQNKIINIRKAYEDARFNRKYDYSTGYVTKTILAVPILNNRGEVEGVLQAINKKEGADYHYRVGERPIFTP